MWLKKEKNEMNIVNKYLKTELDLSDFVCDFKGTLYYIELNSKECPEMCLIEISQKYFVLGCKPYEGTHYDMYSNIIKLNLEDNVDLFFIRNKLSLGWLVDNPISKLLLERIVKELTQ